MKVYREIENLIESLGGGDNHVQKMYIREVTIKICTSFIQHSKHPVRNMYMYKGVIY